MTTNVDIVNRALQIIGTRTTVTAAELTNNTSNEAIQANLVLERLRDETLRMAPWDCGLKTANLVLISSVPGTPENSSPATPLWQPGQPAPPWAYEYQYPVDCLRACWITPANQTGYAGDVPITTAVTGGAPTYWGPPVKFKIQIDQFYPVTAVAIANGGTGYAANEIITLESGATDEPPIGAPAKIKVLTVNGSGVILTCEVVNQIMGESPSQGGSYFEVQTNPVAQGSTTGSGTGATFNLTFGVQGDQRVILTNQEYATLTYVKQVTNPNVMDPLFQEAWASILGAFLAIPLTGDKGLASMAQGKANTAIMEARKVDGNEGLTVNDVTPDFIRVRGVSYTEYYSSPQSQFDWGPTFSYF